MKPEMIAIGASAGGIPAIREILSRLHPSFEVPIVVVQHLPANAKMHLSASFGRFTYLKLCEIDDKMPVKSGAVYFAPPGYHLLVEKEKCFSLSVDEPVHFSRPSIDVFFESAAFVYGASLVGVLLTGANEDGANGLFQIQRQHGHTIVQDPRTAQLETMPKAALKKFEPNFVGGLPQIAALLNQLGASERRRFEDQNLDRR